MTRFGCVAFTLLAGCSFIDDFDRFEARPGASEDAGQNDAGASDSGLDGSRADGGDAGEPSAIDGAAGEGGSMRDADAAEAGSAPDGSRVDEGGFAPDAPSTCASAATACRDGDPCTQDGVCDSAGACVFPAIDQDGDGYSPMMCAPGSALRGGDCNDGDPAVHPGVSELCDGLDNDCNGDTDEGFTRKNCYPDRDGDGYANVNATAVQACTCPAGTREVTDLDPHHNDCWDDPDTGGYDVNPAQTRFFEQGYGPASRRDQQFDYDCDGMTTGYYELLASGGCSGLLGLACGMENGFTSAIPPCGESGEFTICGTSGLTCAGRTEQRKQLCR